MPENKHLIPMKLPLQSSYSLSNDDLFRLVEGYCKALGDGRYEPFYEMIVDMLSNMPESMRPRLIQEARRVLIDEAFTRLDNQKKMEEDTLAYLLDLPEKFAAQVEGNLAKNTLQIFNVLMPKIAERLQEIIQPQEDLLKSALGDPEGEWNSMNPGRERLEKVREICLTRAAKRYPHLRSDLLDWVGRWAKELAEVWGWIDDAVRGKQDFAGEGQLQMLSRTMYAVYNTPSPRPFMPIPARPRREAFMPLYSEAQAAQEILDKLLQERLNIRPILPRSGEIFHPDRHSAPEHLRRPAQGQEEHPNAIYDVREVGAEFNGRVLMKATVGIYKMPEARSAVQTTLPAPVAPQASSTTAFEAAAIHPVSIDDDADFDMSEITMDRSSEE